MALNYLPHDSVYFIVGPITHFHALCTLLATMDFFQFTEVSMLAEHGIAKPMDAVGLTDEQIVEMKIKDEWTPKCFPSGGSVFNKDVIGRRTGNGALHCSLLACHPFVLHSPLHLTSQQVGSLPC